MTSQEVVYCGKMYIRSTTGVQNATAHWMSLKMSFMSFSAPSPAHKQKQTDGMVWCDAVPAIPSHEVSVKPSVRRRWM